MKFSKRKKIDLFITLIIIRVIHTLVIYRAEMRRSSLTILSLQSEFFHRHWYFCQTINPEGHEWNGSVTSNYQYNSIREFCYHHFNCMDNIYMYVRSQLDSRCQLFNIATSESCIIRTSFISHLHTKLGIISRGVSGLSTDSPCGVWDEPVPSCVVIQIWAFLNDCV